MIFRKAANGRSKKPFKAVIARGSVIAALLIGAASNHPLAAAEEPAALRNSLFKATLKNPKDVPLALAYAKACV